MSLLRRSSILGILVILEYRDKKYNGSAELHVGPRVHME